MKLATKIEKNDNFYVKNGYLYNINREDALFYVNDYEHYDYGTHITYYKKGVKVEDNNFGKIEYRFYDNAGNLLSKVKDNYIQGENDIDMYILENGILAKSKDFSDICVYKWTKYNGITKINYDANKIISMINADEQEQGLSL